MLQQDELHVLLGELGLLQGAHQEDVRIGAAGDRDALALEVLDLGDAGILAGDQRRPFGARIDVDRLDRVAVDLADQGRGAGRGAEIERAGIEEFERLVGAEGLDPAHRDAVLRERLLEDALVLEDEADRVVGGVVDADLLRPARRRWWRTPARPRARAEARRGGERRLIGMVPWCGAWEPSERTPGALAALVSRARKLLAQIGACPFYRTDRLLCQTMMICRTLADAATNVEPLDCGLRRTKVVSPNSSEANGISMAHPDTQTHSRPARRQADRRCGGASHRGWSRNSSSSLTRGGPRRRRIC